MVFNKGVIYSCSYSNFHNDSNPLLFVLFSDVKYTIGLNTHYLSKTQVENVSKLIANISKQSELKLLFTNDQRKFYYDILKKDYSDIIDTAYRSYHSSFLIGIAAHPAIHSQIGSKIKQIKTPKKDLILNKYNKFSSNLKLSIDNEKKRLRGKVK